MFLLSRSSRVCDYYIGRSSLLNCDCTKLFIVYCVFLYTDIAYSRDKHDTIKPESPWIHFLFEHTMYNKIFKVRSATMIIITLPLFYIMCNIGSGISMLCMHLGTLFAEKGGQIFMTRRMHVHGRLFSTISDDGNVYMCVW